MKHATGDAAAPHGTPPAGGLPRTYSGAGLDDVQTSHRADIARIAAWLRLGFIVVLAVASALEHPGRCLFPFAQAAVLAGYGLLVLAAMTLGRRHLPVLRPYPRLAAGLLWADVAVVALLQLVSDGSPALALALFLVPMFAAFQLPVRHTAAIAGVCLTAYVLLLAVDSRLRVRTVDENAVAVLAFLVLTCVACLAVARQYQERSDRIHQLTCERTQLLAEVMCAEERERATLAELLHDGPLQSVLAVRLELGTAQRLAGPDDVAIARIRLLDISRQLRDLTAELHPLMLEVKGIGHILNLLVNSTAERAGLRGDCTVEVQHDTENPDPRESLVFTAARELLNNIVLHAAATRFGVSLVDDGGVWRLEVVDDGRGITPGEPHSKLLSGHIGLASQRVRIEAAHGTMAITSGPQGTCVTITLPAPGAAGATPAAALPTEGTSRVEQPPGTGPE
ncbi:sensor histidine kinase [Streptomyces sp. NBC_00096]|uniref:sensor histidine kinase n=1 Tax=Streptomyces sp. NBC_00096 TaxID=2975650 RepID=UPI00324B032D